MENIRKLGRFDERRLKSNGRPDSQLSHSWSIGTTQEIGICRLVAIHTIG